MCFAQDMRLIFSNYLWFHDPYSKLHQVVAELSFFFKTKYWEWIQRPLGEGEAPSMPPAPTAPAGRGAMVVHNPDRFHPSTFSHRSLRPTSTGSLPSDLDLFRFSLVFFGYTIPPQLQSN